MRTKLIVSGLLILTNILNFQVAAQHRGFTFGASYTGDVVSNFSGGIQTGTAYLGFATVNSGFDTEAAGLWKGGNAAVKLANTHGGEPSAKLTGDFQGISNIEAGNLTWLYELWYRQQFKNFAVTVGLQDLNVNFAALGCSDFFINSSFGIHSSIADNVPSPIFPLTALGAEFLWNISPKASIKAALYDGTPDDFENNPFNLNWDIRRDDGYLAVSEFEFLSDWIPGKCGNYKLGIYYHQHNDSVDVEQKNGGFYFSGSQQFSDKVTIFSQVGISPKSINSNNHFFSVGMSIDNFSKKRPNDRFGFAVAHAGIDSDRLRSETAFELTYHLNVTKNLYIRPDLQYIANPAGTNTKLKNAFAGILRFGFEI
jgi:porin